MADTAEQDDGSPSSSSAAPPTNSASNSSWSSGWGSWSQSWIDTVKEKSVHTMEMVKKDLNEFVEVIQGDTSVVISETATKIKPDDGEDDNEQEENTSNFDSLESATKVVRKGMANLLSTVSELMQVPPDDSKEEVITIPDLSPTQTHYNRKQEKLHAIQMDPGTYCTEPEGLFSEWLEVFNLDDNKQVMSNMLVQNPAVRAIYTQLVPAVVSHTTFWQRYFYQVFLLESEEKRREEIMTRANNETNDGDEESSGWGDEDEDDGIEVVSSFALPENSAEDFSIITEEPNKEGDVKDDNCEIIENINTDVALTESHTDTDTCTNLTTETVENTTASENIPDEQNLSNPDENTENSETVQNLSDQTLEMSSELIDIPYSVDVKNDDGPIQQNTEQLATVNKTRLVSPQIDAISQEPNETSSVSSWMSIDDEIKVKKIKGECKMDAKCDLNVSSADVSTDSNGVIVNKSDLLDSDDEDFELDDDVNEADVAKMVDEIKNTSTGGNLDDDDDWEKWE